MENLIFPAVIFLSISLYLCLWMNPQSDDGTNEKLPVVLWLPDGWRCVFDVHRQPLLDLRMPAIISESAALQVI